MIGYRPPNNDKDWEDNWASNSLAWFSDRLGFTPLCDHPQSLLNRYAGWLWTDCSCCYAARYTLVGFLFGQITRGLF